MKFFYRFIDSFYDIRNVRRSDVLGLKLVTKQTNSSNNSTPTSSTSVGLCHALHFV